MRGGNAFLTALAQSRAPGVLEKARDVLPAITMLHREEPLTLDPERLAALCLEIGEARVPEVLSRDMQELSETITRARGLLRAGLLSQLASCAGRVGQIAEPMGLGGLARVAADVAALSATGDDVALAAALARLERIANQSLRLVWMLHDMSG
jgi:hypothetical protein